MDILSPNLKILFSIFVIFTINNICYKYPKIKKWINVQEPAERPGTKKIIQELQSLESKHEIGQNDIIFPEAGKQFSNLWGTVKMKEKKQE